MKKVVTLLMAAVMTFGLATTAFAADSVEADKTSVVGSVDVKGQPVEIVKKETFESAAEQAAVEALKTDPAKVLAETKTNVNASEYVCTSVFDLTVEGNPESINWPIWVTLSVPGVSVGDSVVVLHYVNGAWQSETVSVLEAGMIQVKFDQLSPVSIYVKKDSTATTDGEKANSGSTATTTSGSKTAGTSASTTASTSGKTSPKTGAAPVAEMMIVVAALAAAGMCVTAKKKNA